MKIESFVLLRAIAIAGIIACHVCLQLDIEPMGRCLGFVFVQIFLFMSACLFGLNGGGNENCVDFIKKRWKKLSATYYPFLVISIAILLLTNNTVTLKNVLTHFTYTNYYLKDSICGISFGHLWYISMMMLCYVGIGLLKGNVPWLRKCLHGFGIAVVAVATVLGGIMLQKHGTSSRIIFLFASYLIVYEYAGSIRHYCMSVNRVKMWCLFIICNVACVVLFHIEGFYNMLMTRDTVVILTAMSWICLFLVYSEKIKCCKVVKYVSAISFEIYLIHQPFVFGQFSLFGKTSTGLFAEGMMAICTTVVFAMMLNVLVTRMKQRLRCM